MIVVFGNAGQMLNLDSIAAFIAIATTGSFSEAARARAYGDLVSRANSMRASLRILTDNALRQVALAARNPCSLRTKDQKLTRPIAGLNRPGDGAESR
jgi:hypothetical protein